MTKALVSTIPATNERFRQDIYAGRLFRLPASAASVALTNRAIDITRGLLSPDYRRVHLMHAESELLTKIGALKQAVASDAAAQKLAVSLIVQLGFAADEVVMDVMRIRVIFPYAISQPTRLGAYTAHRDTWYANSQSQINFWLPLSDLEQQDTFAFYPQYFDRPIENSSAAFVYDEWIKSVGFGNSLSQPDALYPAAVLSESDQKGAVRFACKHGDVIAFSGSHLHQTNVNRSERTRYSVDFRLVHVKDHEQRIGAPNADNGSRGNAMKDYISATSLANGISNERN